MRILWYVLIGFCCWWVANAFAGEPICVTQQCIIVVDAGSTGSRAHLLAYDLTASGMPNQMQTLWSNRIAPGLATLPPSQTAIDDYLSALFTGLPAPNVPVYLYATAGMRALPASEQRLYYQLIEAWFTAQARPLLAAKTISGQEEGVLAWLAVALQSDDKTSWSQLGVIDTGGASVQLVFPVPQNAAVPEQDTVELTVDGQPLKLFSYSVLGLGKTSVTEQFLTDDACFPDDYPLPNQQTGQGDIARCSVHIAQWMNRLFAVNEKLPPNGVQLANFQWTVLGGLAYLPRSVVLQLPAGLVEINRLVERAQSRICQVEWTDLYTAYADEAVAFDCLHAAYYHALLVFGYGLPEQTLIDPTLGQAGIDWASGVILLHPH